MEEIILEDKYRLLREDCYAEVLNDIGAMHDATLASD
jgi:hypothetical protein